ncbi:Crp/Fnr family transcriptional regulator [Roseomonas aeriglobus]|nr:Crp/Fnr family transcriptional regulator [Roseomonas aeriglobus]
MDGAAVLTARFASFSPLSPGAMSSVRGVPWQLVDLGTSRSARAFDGLRDRVMVVLSGVLFHHAIVRSGARQVLCLHLPGELVGVDCPGMGTAAIGAHGPAQVAVFDSTAWREMVAAQSSIRAAVEQEVHMNLSIARAWLTNNCRREAATRVAHLLCEVAYRIGGAALPRLTQEFLSDCVGLTSVHTNRVLRRLEAMDCLRRDGDRYQIVDEQRLREFAEFDPVYLTPVVQVPA